MTDYFTNLIPLFILNATAVHNIKGIFRRARRLSAAALSKVGAQSLVDQLAGWQTRDCVLRFDDATGDKVLVYTARHDKQVNIYIYASI